LPAKQATIYRDFQGHHEIDSTVGGHYYKGIVISVFGFTVIIHFPVQILYRWFILMPGNSRNRQNKKQHVFYKNLNGNITGKNKNPGAYLWLCNIGWIFDFNRKPQFLA
jgi:hypothetical protein